MNEFANLTKKAFENYHDMPYEQEEWGLTDALGHIMEFMVWLAPLSRPKSDENKVERKATTTSVFRQSAARQAYNS